MGLNKLFKIATGPINAIDKAFTIATKPLDELANAINKPIKPLHDLIYHVDHHVKKFSDSINNAVIPFIETTEKIKGIHKKITHPFKDVKDYIKHTTHDVKSKVIQPYKTIRDEGRSIQHAFKTQRPSSNQPIRQNYNPQPQYHHVTKTTHYHNSPPTNRNTSFHIISNGHSNNHTHQFWSNAHQAHQTHKNNSNHRSLMKDLQKFNRK